MSLYLSLTGNLCRYGTKNRKQQQGGIYLFSVFLWNSIKVFSLIFYVKREMSTFQIFLNQIDSVGVKIVFFVSDLESEKHGFTVL